ncbi:hypothetical protein LJC43_07615, partial [Parabacteroides sp. OttesenSCG-928-G21]|nr:hypothetical protein [Parabacteroides sp. OttesenSCG-928-G21]
MKIHTVTRLIFLFVAMSMLTPSVLRAEDWRDKMDNIIYSPYYFGPNGFPIPELRSGKIGSRYEVELRGEYHYYSGDKTKDLYARALLPFAKGRAAVEVSMVIVEDYKMTPETQEERFAAEQSSPFACMGDVIISSMFQLLESDKWADIMLSLNLKTASGGRLADARYTDAASYWFDVTVGKNLYSSPDKKFSLRMQGMMGFYCWMTNDRVHRQNDAISYGIGATGMYRHFSLSTDLSGFHG